MSRVWLWLRRSSSAAAEGWARARAGAVRAHVHPLNVAQDAAWSRRKRAAAPGILRATQASPSSTSGDTAAMDSTAAEIPSRDAVPFATRAKKPTLPPPPPPPPPLLRVLPLSLLPLLELATAVVFDVRGCGGGGGGARADAPWLMRRRRTSGS